MRRTYKMNKNTHLAVVLQTEFLPTESVKIPKRTLNFDQVSELEQVEMEPEPESKQLRCTAPAPQ
jgi:hypothetical protein